jgi:hypothetical protein
MKILTIAIGERYLNMACTLAASVYGKHEIMLVTDQDVQGRKADLFTDIIEPFYVGETDLETAMINKLHIDHYGGGEPVLFLDADTIITRPIDERNLKPFEAIVLHKSIKYPDWCNHEEAKKLYGFTEYIRHNTSWLYCDGSKQSVAIFDKARSVYEDIKKGVFKAKDFRGEVVDEVCIDIAVSSLGCIGKQKSYLPLYLPFVYYNGFIHTQDNYNGITLAGQDISGVVLTHYNKLKKYYNDIVGIETIGVKKKCYKNFDDNTPQVVDSCNVEFGYELISALPYAWHLHQKGMLLGTRSGIDTACLYWFSPKHEINEEQRSWANMDKAKKVLPNINIHNHELDWRYFLPPPLKAQHGWQLDLGNKPIVCICNRINIEWGKEVINYFDLDCLEKLFIKLTPKYRLVYFNIASKPQYADGVELLEIGDSDLARKYGVDVIHDLHAQQYSEFSFNHFQMLVFGQCERFITMNGGYSILASYFGGTNIIYSKECKEITPTVNSFYRWYHKFGGSRIVHVDTYEKLHETVHDIFVEEKQLVNILIRTHNRPNHFAKCYESIISQTYKNVNIIVGYHDEDAHQYLIPYRVKPVRYEKFEGEIPPPPNNTEYGRPFTYNYYLDLLNQEVQDGWIMYLDDDDAFEHENALQTIVDSIESVNDLIMWRIQLNNGVILPSDENFGKAPVPRGISGITFMAHSIHVKKTTFGLYRWGDYRVIKALYDKLNHVFINECLTKMQNGECGMGKANDIF